MPKQYLVKTLVIKADENAVMISSGYQSCQKRDNWT